MGQCGVGRQRRDKKAEDMRREMGGEKKVVNVKRIYADWAATAPVSPHVLEAMLPYWDGRESFGNPSSLHDEGIGAARALRQAREEIAVLLDADPEEIYFTSGGTESDNWAIRGVCEGAPRDRRRILTSALEHPAVRHTCTAMQKFGFAVTMMPVSERGRVKIPPIPADTALVTLMAANHVIGTIQKIPEAVEQTHRAGAVLLCDGVQAAATQPICLHRMGVDLFSLSGHKLGTPRGIGLLYIRRGVRCLPLLYGGGQEGGLRSGTQNPAGAVGLACALRLARENQKRNGALAAMAQKLRDGLQEIPGTVIRSAEGEAGVPGLVYATFDGLRGESLVGWLNHRGIAVSADAACSSAGQRPSEVLTSMGLDEETAFAGVRFSLSWQNTPGEVEAILAAVSDGVARLRDLS